MLAISAYPYTVHTTNDCFSKSRTVKDFSIMSSTYLTLFKSTFYMNCSFNRSENISDLSENKERERCKWMHVWTSQDIFEILRNILLKRSVLGVICLQLWFFLCPQLHKHRYSNSMYIDRQLLFCSNSNLEIQQRHLLDNTTKHSFSSFMISIVWTVKIYEISRSIILWISSQTSTQLYHLHVWN